MYKHILVPIVFDHHPSAEQAIGIAKALMADGGKITLLHVVEDIPSYAATMIPQDVWSDSIKHAHTNLKELANAHAPDAKVEVVQGHPSRAILDFSDGKGADCIVISSHKPGLEDYLLGSTAARVVRHAYCAVHVLR